MRARSTSTASGKTTTSSNCGGGPAATRITRDLTVASGDTSLPNEYHRPTSHVLADTQHVFHASNDAEMIELWWQA